MNWSDAERKLAEEERQRQLDAEHMAARQAEKQKQEQIINSRAQQFLAAMKKAGNPGIQYDSFLDRLRGKGYWEYHGNGYVSGSVGTDGGCGCTLPNDTPTGKRGSADDVVKMLVNILRRHHVPIPED